MKNVVIINDFDYVQGGASKVAIETAELLCKKYNVIFFSAVTSHEKHNNKITYISTEQSECLKDKNKIRGIFNGIYNFKSAKKLKRILKTLNKNETVIHVHGWTKALSCSIFRYALKNNYKVVLTLHDYFTVCPNGGFFDYKKNEICKLNPMCYKCIKNNCDSRNYGFKLYRIIRQFVQDNIVGLRKKIKYAIGISDLNIKVLKKYLNENVYIEKIYNPIDFDLVTPKNDVSRNDKYIYIGRVTKEKGVEIFCRELSLKNYNGIVIGDGSELEKLKKKYENIQFVGWKSKNEIQKYLKQARMLIFPSLWYEGAPLTPLEAMSYGIPCVVSNCSSATEYFKEKNGEIFNPYIKDDLINKIDLINKNIDTYSENAYQYMINYKKNDYVKEIEKFYRGVIDEKDRNNTRS